MKRRTWLQASLGAGILGALAVGAPGLGALRSLPVVPGLQWRERLLLGFGTSLSLRAAHGDPAQADAALAAAVGTIRRIEAQMSLFRDDSDLVRLNRDGVLESPPAELVDVLQLAQSVSARSDGAFDVTVQPLWQAFAAAQRAGRLPTPHEVEVARARVGWQALEVTPERIRFLRPGMALTLNGIAQGYAADRVRDELQRFGVEHALINTGEWAALGRSPAQQPWTIGIADPRDAAAIHARMALDGRSLATSADNESAFSADFRHHHIFDPRSGYSPQEIASVTVAAPRCVLADALAKVMFVGGVAAALAVAREWGADALIVDKAGRLHTTPGLAVG